MFTCLKIRALICLLAVAAIGVGCSQQDQAPGNGQHGTSPDENWGTNLEAALTKAKTANKMVFVDFTGSDWCPPCKALKKNVFNSDEFKAYAKKHLVLVELDFPRDKSKVTKEQAAYNREQAKAFAVRGYPTVILMDADGKELTKKVGFGRTSAEKYIAALSKAIK